MEWQHPFTCIIAGPTSCGKSVFVSKFLKHIDTMVNVDVKEIVWCFGECQPLHEVIRNSITIPIIFLEGLPKLNDIAPEINAPPRLLIIDDLMTESNTEIVNLFSKGSHHRNLSIIYITQNIFHQGKGSRDISLNAHYSIIFKNPRDKSQILHYARQVHPENPKFIQEAFLDATSKPHSYLLFDMKQTTPDAFRFRSDIFPGESNVVYVPRHAGREVSKFYYV
jgi:hypothetical protein